MSWGVDSEPVAGQSRPLDPLPLGALGSCEFEGGDGAGSAPRASGGGPVPLPCLSSNNCISLPDEAAPEIVEDHRKLQSNHKKTASLLAWTVADLAAKHGIERLGFLTLTFADHVKEPKEAQKRWHSLKTNVLNRNYACWIRVFERQVSGRIHYHVLVVLDADIRTGVDFSAFVQGDYRTANPRLRAEWAFWRSTSKAYGFGRTELLPVKSSAEGISRYVGKYISKHIGNRETQDKGVRLVEFSKGSRMGNTRFAWNSPGAWVWRQKLKRFAEINGCKTFEDLGRKFGPKWAYHCHDAISGIVLTKYPTSAHAWADGHTSVPPDLINVHCEKQRPKMTMRPYSAMTPEDRRLARLYLLSQARMSLKKTSLQT